MSSPVKTLNAVENVENVLIQLQTNSFNGWPIINSEHKLIGMINRDTLVALVEHECWYTEESTAPTFGIN